MPNAPTVLALDAGTSSLKIGVLDFDGGLRAFARVPVPAGPAGQTQSAWNDGKSGRAGQAAPHGAAGAQVGSDLPGEAGGTEQTDLDPREWIGALKSAVDRLGEQARRVDAVVVSGNGPTIVAVDKDLKPVGNAIPWYDGHETRIEGVRSFFLPKLAYYLRSEPKRFSGARHFLGCPEYLCAYLTGNPATISPSDEFLPYIWDKAGIEAYGFDTSAFPAPVPIGGDLGGIMDGPAAELGLAGGTPVYAGGPDFLVSLIGTGTTVPGRVCDRAGTSEGINYCRGEWLDDPGLRCLPHAVPGLYNVAAVLSSTGRIFEWFRRMSGQQHVPYGEMFDRIASASTSADLPRFFPSGHVGARWEFSKGLFVGLGAEHGPAEMGWAVVESIGYAVREAVEILEDAGCAFSSIRLSGGQAKNHHWNQMKADITGKHLLVPRIVDAELVGNLCAAMAGMGEASGPAEAADRVVKIAREYTPNAKARDRFEDGYQAYRRDHARFLDN